MIDAVDVRLFDGRRVYSPAQAEKAGLEYYTIGS